MTAIRIFDGQNVLLRDLERSHTHHRLTLRQRYEQACADKALHIWVFDGRGHNHRRKTIYPEYKANRTPIGEDRFSQMGVLREALQHSPAWQVECDGWEGDDVIGALVHRFAARGDIPITVHTNDLDYAQLLTYPTVRLDGVAECPCPPHYLPLYKALVGDPSDNIKGIHGFGKKTFAELEPFWMLIQQAIEEENLEALLTVPFKPAIKAWIIDSSNLLRLKCMLTVTRFLPVPDDELSKGISKGSLNRSEADKIFKRFFL